MYVDSNTPGFRSILIIDSLTRRAVGPVLSLDTDKNEMRRLTKVGASWVEVVEKYAPNHYGIVSEY